MPNETAIDRLAESVWRRVVGWEESEMNEPHGDCCVTGVTSGDPDDCPLFREIHDEITMWATKRAKPPEELPECEHDGCANPVVQKGAHFCGLRSCAAVEL